MALILVLVPATVRANVDETWVWCDADARVNDSLTYCIIENTFNEADLTKAGDDNDWNELIASAASMWSDTKWSVTQEPGNNCDNADIKFKAGNTRGAGQAAATTRRDGKCLEMCTITVRNAALGGGFWHGTPTTPDAKKNNPLNSLKHELGHCLMLDHQNSLRTCGSTAVECVFDDDCKEQAMVANRFCTASHVMHSVNTSRIELSAQDAAMGNESAMVELPKEQDSAISDTDLPVDLFFEGYVVSIPSGGLVSSPAIIGIQPLSEHSAPDLGSIGEGEFPLRLVRAVSLFSTDFVASNPIDTEIVCLNLVSAATITVTWTPTDLEGDEWLDHQPEILQPLFALDPQTIRPYAYSRADGVWNEITPSSFDPLAGEVSFPVSSLCQDDGMEGLAARAFAIGGDPLIAFVPALSWASRTLVALLVAGMAYLLVRRTPR